MKDQAIAGERILGTLWDAHHETCAALIPETIRGIADGAPPAAALWEAQREWLTFGRTDAPIRASPFFWAGAVVFE